MATRITIQPKWADGAQSENTTIVIVTVELSNVLAMLSLYDMLLTVTVTAKNERSYPYTFIITDATKQEFLFEAHLLGNIEEASQVSSEAVGYWIRKA